jgi:hypothetical protein
MARGWMNAVKSAAETMSSLPGFDRPSSSAVRARGTPGVRLPMIGLSVAVTSTSTVAVPNQASCQALLPIPPSAWRATKSRDPSSERAAL